MVKEVSVPGGKAVTLDTISEKPYRLGEYLVNTPVTNHNSDRDVSSRYWEKVVTSVQVITSVILGMLISLITTGRADTSVALQ